VTALALGLALILTGCMSADPALWIGYSRVTYAYGRIESRAELHCAPPVPADRGDVCAEAKRAQANIRAVVPIVEAELSKPRVDWAQVAQLIDLILKLSVLIP
jgi:hypothetical protein